MTIRRTKAEAQRIAIAEACGWRVYERHVGLNLPSNLEAWEIGKIGEQHHDVRQRDNLPNYLNDLNAMHEAEKVLTREQGPNYYYTLCAIVGRSWHATAAQQAEAFLRTIGKWEDKNEN